MSSALRLREEVVHIVGRRLMFAMVIFYSLGHADNVAKFLLSVGVDGPVSIHSVVNEGRHVNHDFKALIQIA
jgi:hypothetical protein